MRDKDKLEKLKPFDEARYENVDLDHLIVYVVAQLEKAEVDLSFENAVVAAFRLFPKKFSLLGYPEYPDSNRAHKCLWRCTSKSKQWLGGRVRQGFIITNRSRIFIEQTEELLTGVSSKRRKATSQTRRKELLLGEVLSSPAYTKYTEHQKDSITRAEFCFVLQGTLDSSHATLRKNLDSLKNLAVELNRDDVSEFLNWSEKHFREFLEG